MAHFCLKKFSLLIFFLCLFALGFLGAQEDCSTILSKAQKSYDAGVIEQIPKMLQSCIESGFTREEKTQAYKLIIMSYLFDNNTKMAEAAMLDFLRRYPEYEIQPSDQAEFVQLFNNYRTLPVASFGITLGTNISNISVIRLYNNPKFKGDYSVSGFSYQLGFSYRHYLFDKFDINAELYYLQRSYQYSCDSVTAGNKINFTETQQKIELPLTIVYFPYVFGKFTPYARAGVNLGFLLNASASDTRQELNSSKAFTDANVSVANKRNKFQVMLVLGAGICYNIKHSNIFFDIRYNIGLENQVVPGKRNDLNDLGLALRGYYTDNDFRISNLLFSIGYNYKFYKPEKR
jgi:hypothetical protein